MFDAKKFKDLVYYICWKCSDDPSKLGAIKLNKILWLSDVINYSNTGTSITGAPYIRQQFGPVAKPLLRTLIKLQNERLIRLDKVPHHGYDKTQYIVLGAPPTEFLTDKEYGLVDRIIDFVRDNFTGAQISEFTHDHIWKAAANGEDLPHFTVFAHPGKITDKDRAWARLQLKKK